MFDVKEEFYSEEDQKRLRKQATTDVKERARIEHEWKECEKIATDVKCLYGTRPLDWHHTVRLPLYGP